MAQVDSRNAPPDDVALDRPPREANHHASALSGPAGRQVRRDLNGENKPRPRNIALACV